MVTDFFKTDFCWSVNSHLHENPEYTRYYFSRRFKKILSVCFIHGRVLGYHLPIYNINKETTFCLYLTHVLIQKVKNLTESFLTILSFAN